MSLNIKDEEVHKMAAELAAIRGVTMTAVVKDVLQKQLAAERPKEDPDAKAKRLIAWVKQVNKGRKRDKNLTSDHSWLYDEHGLPR
jgi:antitoxin VapB